MQQAEMLASGRLYQADFHNSSLEDLDLPDVQYTEWLGGVKIPYAVFGDLDAPKVLFATSPYGCKVDDESQMVRLKAQQIALGDEACVVGLHVYEPKNLELSYDDKKKVADGSFLPFADRVLAVMKEVDPKDDQQVGLYGFSMGADVSVETAYQMISNDRRGEYPVDMLGAIEPARVTARGTMAVVRAFGKSGKGLYDNVLESNSPALLEARGIDPEDSKARKKHDSSVRRGVMKYNAADVSGNLAIVRGFSGDDTLRQLNKMASSDDMPPTLVGRMADSRVSTPDFLKRLSQSESIETFEMPGDHSLGDNVRKSAAFMARTVLISPRAD